MSAVDELRRIVGFGSMCWTSVDPATWLPSWVISDNPVVGRHQRLLHRSWPTARDLTALAERGFTATTVSTGGDLARDQGSLQRIVQLVQLLLDPRRARGAGHPADRQFHRLLCRRRHGSPCFDDQRSHAPFGCKSLFIRTDGRFA